MAKEEQKFEGKYEVIGNILKIFLPTQGVIKVYLLKKNNRHALLSSVRKEQEKMEIEALYGEFFSELRAIKAIDVEEFILKLLKNDSEMANKVIAATQEVMAKMKEKK